MEDNKLIAEFMGWTFTKREDGNYDIKKDGVETWEVGTDADFKSGATYSGCFSYSEWNDIMPISQKIEKYLWDNHGKVGYFDECLQSNDIEVRYQSVVEFIKFYNQKK